MLGETGAIISLIYAVLIVNKNLSYASLSSSFAVTTALTIYIVIGVGFDREHPRHGECLSSGIVGSICTAIIWFTILCTSFAGETVTIELNLAAWIACSSLFLFTYFFLCSAAYYAQASIRAQQHQVPLSNSSTGSRLPSPPTALSTL